MGSCPLLPLSVGTDTPRRRAAASPRSWDTASVASTGCAAVSAQVNPLLRVKKKGRTAVSAVPLTLC